MARRHISRALAGAAVVEVTAALIVWAGAGPAAATNCTAGLAPDFLLTQTVIPPASGATATGYDLTVTNYGTCGATDVQVQVQLPAGATYAGYASGSRSWSCALDGAVANQVDCLLQAQLDQTSTSSTGAAGKAEVIVTAVVPAPNGGRTPPDVTDHAVVIDTPQVTDPPDSDDEVWGGAINSKTGGSVSTGFSDLAPTIATTVTVPSGVAGSVGLTQNTPDPTCAIPPPGHATCTADVLLNAPAIANGYSTIVMKVLGTVAPPTPAYDEGSGVFVMQPCKGKTATPPCVDNIKGYNLNNPSAAYYLVTIHDSDGTHIWS